MNKRNIYLVSIVIVVVVLAFIGYKYIDDSRRIKNQLHDEVKLLVDEARNIYKYVGEGGSNPLINQNDLSKMLIVDPNINTKEKLITFLHKVYTDKAAKKIYNKFGYKEIDGKIYKPITDSVFVHDWNKAYLEDIKINPLNKNATVIFIIPNSISNREDTVKFKLIKGTDNTYRIDDMINGW